MSIDWDVYSEEIDEEIDSSKDDFKNIIFDTYRDYIGEKVYFFLEKMIPIIDLERDEFTLRLSYQCAFNKKDKRNILFNLEEEIEDYDCSNLDRLDRLKEIFRHSINLVNEKIKILEKE